MPQWNTSDTSENIEKTLANTSQASVAHAHDKQSAFQMVHRNQLLGFENPADSLLFGSSISFMN
jgi:hypothetical protein